jgi:hypothetical protein
MKHCLVTTTLVMTLTIARLDAITVVPMTFEQLVQESDAVIYARVGQVRGQWTADRRSIESVVTLDALRYFKGGFGESVHLRLPGGEAGGRLSVLPGAPVLRQGELVVVFLRSQPPAIPTVLGLTQGLFRVVPDARTGVALVTPPPLKSSTVGRVIRGAAERRTLTVDAFAAAVREAESVR